MALLGVGTVARAVRAAPDFATRVVPALTKAGCNAGSCHGAALGRGGFRLSLLGYDPGRDHDSLVHEFEGRRVEHWPAPRRASLLRKPAGELDHEGGPRLSSGGEGYRILRDWIAAGAAPRPTGRSPRSLDVEPVAATLAATGQSVPLRVIAQVRRRHAEDVTRWATYTPADPGSSRCSPRGEVTALRRGRAVVDGPLPGRRSAARPSRSRSDDAPARTADTAAGELHRRPRQPDAGRAAARPRRRAPTMPPTSAAFGSI